MNPQSRVFPALLKFWRERRGKSQLELAFDAEVSARHISFLETGRSRPGEEMVLLLAAALEVPLRERNVMLREAGYAPAFDESGLDALADPGVAHALDAMLRHHEPYPMLILDRGYDVVRHNSAAGRLIAHCLGGVPEQWNAVRAFFDPAGVRPHVRNWDTLARGFIARIHREALLDPRNERIQRLLQEALATPGVPDAWRKPDLTLGTEGALTMCLAAGEVDLRFVVTMSVFQAPQNVTLQELQIESYFPADAATEEACKVLFSVAAA